MGIIFLVAISILVFMGYRYITQGLNPIDAESEEVIEIEIPSGSTRRDIANILEKNELINSSLIFDFYVRFSRSEEHTSELQSRGHLVCRLLLEKKKI